VIAAATVLVPVVGIWTYDHADFMSVCEGEGKPVVFRRDKADGIFLNSETSNSFGMRYLHEEGFLWMEAPSVYTRGTWVRYERGPKGEITTTENVPLTARYEVREDFSRPHTHTDLTQVKVIERQTGELLATAGAVHFSGGTMKWVLGTWGSRSCPTTRTDPDDFNAYYHLVKNTLR